MGARARSPSTTFDDARRANDDDDTNIVVVVHVVVVHVVVVVVRDRIHPSLARARYPSCVSVSKTCRGMTYCLPIDEIYRLEGTHRDARSSETGAERRLCVRVCVCVY